MGLQDIIAIGFAALAVLYVGRKMIRALFGKSRGCARGCGCGSETQPSDSASPGLKRIPIVPLDQVGLTLSKSSKSSDRH